MFVAPESRTIATRGASRASTLLEMVIAMGIVTLLASAVVAIAMSSGRSFAEIMNYIDLGRDNRYAVDRVTRDLRQMSYLSAFDTNSLTFVDPNGSTVRYQYDPQARVLVRTQDGVSSTLLSQCDSLQFGIFERPPLTNTFDLVTATEATNCKVVSLTWNCSRGLLGRTHTESAQTARIVLRNKQE